MASSIHPTVTLLGPMPHARPGPATHARPGPAVHVLLRSPGSAFDFTSNAARLLDRLRRRRSLRLPLDPQRASDRVRAARGVRRALLQDAHRVYNVALAALGSPHTHKALAALWAHDAAPLAGVLALRNFRDTSVADCTLAIHVGLIEALDALGVPITLRSITDRIWALNAASGHTLAVFDINNLYRLNRARDTHAARALGNAADLFIKADGIVRATRTPGASNAAGNAAQRGATALRSLKSRSATTRPTPSRAPRSPPAPSSAV